jgi:hypothetical protein
VRGRFSAVENVRRRCPRCREEVEVEPGAQQAVCPACSAIFNVLAPLNVKSAAPARSQLPVAVAGLAVLAIAGVVAQAFIHRATEHRDAERLRQRPIHATEQAPREMPSAGSPAWFALQPPTIFTLADGGEAFAGLVRSRSDRSSALSLAAFDADLHALWQSESLGLTQEGILAFQVSGDEASIVVTDARRTVRVYAAQTGTPRFALPMPGVAHRLCRASAGRFEIVTGEGAAFTLDVEKQHLTPGSLGACPDAMESRTRAKVPLTDAQLEAGTPDLVQRGAGMAVIKVSARDAPFHPHVLAHDLDTGKLRFDRELPREEHLKSPALTITARHIYVPSDGALFVLDAATGAIVGRIGD